MKHKLSVLFLLSTDQLPINEEVINVTFEAVGHVFYSDEANICSCSGRSCLFGMLLF